MRWRNRAGARVLVFVLSVAALAPHALGATPTALGGPDLTLALEPVLQHVPNPVGAADPGDGSGRLFVVSQHGTIVVWDGREVRADPFLDLTPLIGRAGSETGLLGLTFHPRYRENGRFFVYYTALDGANTVARYQVSDANPDRADPQSGVILLALPDRYPEWHNGGHLAFGPDGYLYVGTGDEGATGDAVGNAQNLGSLFGKLLRLDVDGSEPYGIPPDNPFVSTPGARPEIWAYGLRNPWSFSWDRATGDLWIADVGQDSFEEINVIPAGSPGGHNLGWNVMEADQCFPPGYSCPTDGLTLPVASYSHAEGCAIIGGFVYRGARFPALAGRYLYADICAGTVSSLAPDGQGGWEQALLLDSDLYITSLAEDAAGELYVTAFQRGSVLRVVAGDSFGRLWSRTDASVADGAAERSWVWGPEPLAPVMTEPYADAPEGRRFVQYFDKGRLEINDPARLDGVTAGLLAVELITGRLQIGDATFEQREPAMVNVAGDPDDPSGPTYATLVALLDAPATPPGAPLTMRLARDGTVVDDPGMRDRGAVAAERVTVPGLDHTVASPFWDFMTSSGLVEQDGVLVEAPLFASPFAAVGLPITEAYWTVVRVNGDQRDVLLQCFERRCLTWTPENPPAWQVELGNVGRHYYLWRYGTDSLSR